LVTLAPQDVLSIESDTDTDVEQQVPEKRGRPGVFTQDQQAIIARYIKPWRAQLTAHDPFLTSYARPELLEWRRVATDIILAKDAFQTLDRAVITDKTWRKVSIK
jgi:hypothetical protein